MGYRRMKHALALLLAFVMALPAAAQRPDAERAALLAALTGDRPALAALHQQAAARRDAATANQTLYLFNSGLRDRDEYLLAMEIAARETDDKEMRTKFVLALLEDEYYEIAQLKGENQFNRFSGIFNRASSSLSKLALFQPQDAMQLLLDAAYGRRKARGTTDRERRMAYLCGVFLEKHPRAPETPEVAELQRLLREKLRAELVQRYKVAGELREKRADLAGAEFHFENASLMSPDDAELKATLARVRSARRAQTDLEGDVLGVTRTEESLEKADRDRLAKAARALVAGDRPAFAAVAGAPGRVDDSIAYAATSWFESTDQHDSALQQLAATKGGYPGYPGGRAAAALLTNPRYNLDDQFDLAVAELRKQRQKFILTGRRTVEDQGYMLGSAAIQTGGQGIGGVPALFVTDILVRGVAEHFKTQMETDLVVDAGARYIRRYEESPRASEIAAMLADLCAKAGDADRAAAYLALAGGDANANPKIREDKARKLMDSAMAAGDLARRKRVLEHLAAEYSETKIAATARKELAAMPPNISASSVLLPVKALAEAPGLTARLGIPPEYADGKRSNGELADPGVVIDPENGSVAYRTGRGQPYAQAQMPGEQREQVLVAVRSAAAAYETKLAEQAAIKRQVLPVEIRGGAGGAGVELSPRLVPVPDREGENRYFQD